MKKVVLQIYENQCRPHTETRARHALLSLIYCFGLYSIVGACINKQHLIGSSFFVHRSEMEGTVGDDRDLRNPMKLVFPLFRSYDN